MSKVKQIIRLRVNAISPGPIESPIWGKMNLPEEAMKEFGATILKQVPLGRRGRPDEVANAVLFLGSNDSSYVTGIELPADEHIVLNKKQRRVCVLAFIHLNTQNYEKLLRQFSFKMLR